MMVDFSRHRNVTTMIKGSTARHRQHDVDALFTDRWSPRALSGEPLTATQLEQLLEAARWAPSASNSQPWRFLYALRDGDFFPAFLDLLVPANQAWAQRAGALLVVLSRTHGDDGRPLRSHSYDTGAAWMSLALQASISGLICHGIGGFDPDKARRVLRVPDGYAVEAMAVLGHPGDAASLTEPLRAREKPSDRRPQEQSACEGPFAF
jgi:nitroreductase